MLLFWQRFWYGKCMFVIVTAISVSMENVCLLLFLSLLLAWMMMMTLK